jgi:hypothetical protein
VVAGLALAGCGSDGTADEAAAPTATPTATWTPKPAEFEPIAAAEQSLSCRPAIGYAAGGGRFVVRGRLRNTGEVAIRLRVAVRWMIPGRDERARKLVRLREGGEKRVTVTKEVDTDTLRRWDEAKEVTCRMNATIRGRKGKVTPVP